MSYSGTGCESQQESGIACDDIRYARLRDYLPHTLVAGRRGGGSWWARGSNRLESSIFLLPFRQGARLNGGPAHRGRGCRGVSRCRPASSRAPNWRTGSSGWSASARRGTGPAWRNRPRARARYTVSAGTSAAMATRRTLPSLAMASVTADGFCSVTSSTSKIRAAMVLLNGTTNSTDVEVPATR